MAARWLQRGSHFVISRLRIVAKVCTRREKIGTVSKSVLGFFLKLCFLNEMLRMNHIGEVELILKLLFVEIFALDKFAGGNQPAEPVSDAALGDVEIAGELGKGNEVHSGICVVAGDYFIIAR